MHYDIDPRINYFSVVMCLKVNIHQSTLKQIYWPVHTAHLVAYKFSLLIQN